LKQTDAAAALHVSGETISAWESDEGKISFAQLLMLAQVYGVPFEELIGGSVDNVTARRDWPPGLMEYVRSADAERAGLMPEEIGMLARAAWANPGKQRTARQWTSLLALRRIQMGYVIGESGDGETADSQGGEVMGPGAV
jgi:transcriptional regulator with XRE-family HTH domain